MRWLWILVAAVLGYWLWKNRHVLAPVSVTPTSGVLPPVVYDVTSVDERGVLPGEKTGGAQFAEVTVDAPDRLFFPLKGR